MTGAKTPDDAKVRDFEERLDGDGANRTPPVGAFTARSETEMVVSEALEIYGPEFDSRQLHDNAPPASPEVGWGAFVV